LGGFFASGTYAAFSGWPAPADALFLLLASPWRLKQGRPRA
jgi:hypothetical protein